MPRVDRPETSASVAPLPMVAASPIVPTVAPDGSPVRVAPEATVTPPPRLPPPLSCKVPPDTVVVPVSVFAPVRTSVPGPFCSRVPLPEITPEKVTESERLKTKLP